MTASEPALPEAFSWPTWDGTPPGAWVAWAACAGLEGFCDEYPHHRDDRSMLARICQHCPVRADCASYADSEPGVWGWWGGEWRNGRARRRDAA